MPEKNFEKSIERLEEIVGKMESGDLTLDQALAYYEEGIKLSRFCYGKLGEAEKKVEKLVKKQNRDAVAYDTEETDIACEDEKA